MRTHINYISLSLSPGAGYVGYAGRTNGRDLHSQKETPVSVCGVRKNDKTDVRLTDRSLT